MKNAISIFSTLFFIFIFGNLQAQSQCKPNPACEKVMECCKEMASKASTVKDLENCCKECALPECCKAELVKSGACTPDQMKAVKNCNPASCSKTDVKAVKTSASTTTATKGAEANCKPSNCKPACQAAKTSEQKKS